MAPFFPGKSCLGPGEGGQGGDAGGFGFSFDFSLDLARMVSARDFSGVFGPTDFLLFIISSICDVNNKQKCQTVPIHDLLKAPTMGVGLTIDAWSFSSFSSTSARCSLMAGEGEGQLETAIDPDKDFLLLVLCGRNFISPALIRGAENVN